MKRSIAVTLSVIALSLAATTSVKAETKTEHIINLATTMGSPTARPRISPFELVSLAYQGVYTMQGISGFGSFIGDASNGKVMAKDLVQAAIDAKELSSEIKLDRDYLNAVTFHLTSTRY